MAVCAAAALLPLPGYLLALVIGLGNSLFHVAGGTVTLKGARDAGPLGVFVAPGAVGLALGTLWPGLRGALCAAALVTAAALVFAGRGEPELQFPEGRKDTPWGAVLLLTLAVAVRAVGGCAVEFPWKTGAGMAMLAAAFVFAGKTLGGFGFARRLSAPAAQPPATTPRQAPVLGAGADGAVVNSARGGAHRLLLHMGRALARGAAAAESVDAGDALAHLQGHARTARASPSVLPPRRSGRAASRAR